jgi:hypothetical protein
MAYLASARSNTLALRQLGANVENDDVRAGLNRQHKAVDDWAAGNVQAALEEVDLFLDQKKNFTGKKDLIGAGDVSKTSVKEMLADNPVHDELPAQRAR